MEKMKFRCPFKVILLLFILSFLLSACIPRMTLRETAHYRLYENIVLTPARNMGMWKKSDIQIPRGAIVAVMVKGEIWDIGSGWHWQPHQCLRFKIGEDGREAHIDPGIYLKDPSNLNVIPSVNGGPLYFGMGTWWKGNLWVQNKRGELIVRVIVWEKGHQDRIEGDLLELIRTHPTDQQFRDLVALMALCFREMEEYEKVQNLHRMIRENPEVDWERVYPYVLIACGGVEMLLGRNERVKAYAEESLKRIRRFGNRYTESTALRLMALAASNLGQYEEAILLSEQSLKIAEELKSPEFIGRSLRAIGENLLSMNRPAEAVVYFKKTLQQISQSDRWLTQRWCYLSLGYSYMKLNKNDEAKESFKSAIQVAARAGDSGPQWRAYGAMGGIAEKEGDNQRAFEHYAEAIKIIESMRAKVTAPGLKAVFLKDTSAVYESMIRLLYKMQRTSEALDYLERARARVMLDMLAEKAFSSKNKEENELLVQERALRQRIDELSIGQERIGFERPQEVAGEISRARESEKQTSELERLQSEHRDILKRIEELNPELASLVSIGPLKTDEIQVLLDRDTVLLEYFVGVEGRFVFVVTREKVLAVPLEVDSEKLFQKIRDFRVRAVENITLDRLVTKTYEKPISELYQILIQPIEGEISGKKNLVIVPHGMLHYLPFQALLSKEGKYLIESFTISYLPSASVLKYARARNKGNRADLFAVGNPATGLSPLPASEVEVKEVSAIFDRKLVVTGQEATKILVKSRGPQYDMILLSTHGEMIESNPLQSNLRFTPSGGDDGRLTVSEIFDMEIRANLVTLSACETALLRGETGDFPQGDDLVGLSRAFIHAGAPSVLASLWKVSDDSTVELMKAFYRNLQGMSKAEALRKAQMDLMKSSIRFHTERSSGGITESINYRPDTLIECSHPFFWAPFILIGDWR